MEVILVPQAAVRQKKFHLNINVTQWEFDQLELLVGKSYGAKTRIMRALLRQFINTCKDKTEAK